MLWTIQSRGRGMRTIIIIFGICSLAASAAVSAATAAAPMTATQAKAQNAEALAENKLITLATQAENADDWAGAETALKQLTAMDPGRWQYQQALGDAEFHEGKYQEAVASYETALSQAVKDKLKSTRQAMATMYTNQGNAYLKLHKEDEALAAYTKAASLSDNPATAYFNVCAVFYNSGKMDQALAACDKAIAADPKKADAYFIKGSVLLGNATVDAGGKTTYPPGTAEALQMYLKLAPTGPHAADVQQMLDFINGKTN